MTLLLKTNCVAIRSILEKKMQCTLVFSPGRSHGQSSLVGYSPLGHKKSDMTQELKQQQSDLFGHLISFSLTDTHDIQDCMNQFNSFDPTIKLWWVNYYPHFTDEEIGEYGEIKQLINFIAKTQTKVVLLQSSCF